MPASEKYHTGARVIGLICGVAANALSYAIFFACFRLIYSHDSQYTTVLSWTPAIQGALVIPVVYFAWKLNSNLKWLSTGLWIGLVLQLAAYCLWYQNYFLIRDWT